MAQCEPARAAVPWRALGAPVAVAWAVLYATLGRYGYHRDELYFRLLPARWGYFDQSFLTPLIAHVSTSLLGDTLWGLRATAPLFFAAGVVLAALTTRELGGTSRQQAWSALGFALSLVPLLSGHLLLTATPDIALCALLLYAITRALLREPRWWLVAGAAAGVAADNKLLVVLPLLALLAGLLAAGPRDAFRQPPPWGGLVLATVLAAPTIVYQLTHGMPEWTMARTLHEQNGADVRVQVIPFQFLLLGVPLTLVAGYGFVGLVRHPPWRVLRALAVAYVVAVLLNLGAGGQVYYAFPLLAYLMAAGWARIDFPTPAVVGLLAVNGVIVAFIALPLMPVRHDQLPAALNPTIGDQTGWPTYVATLQRVVDRLPARQRAHAAIVTSNYGEAGAVSRYGVDLPPVYSGLNALYALGPPPTGDDVVVLWTEDYAADAARFTHCRRLGTMDNGVNIDNEEQGSAVGVCRLRPGGWPAVWPALRHTG
jgi:hypothetical protein